MGYGRHLGQTILIFITNLAWGSEFAAREPVRVYWLQLPALIRWSLLPTVVLKRKGEGGRGLIMGCWLTSRGVGNI